MSNRNKQKKRKRDNASKKQKGHTPLPKESQGAEAMTVAWLLCILATIIAVLLALVGRWMYWNAPNDQTGMASGVLTFSSVVTGTLTVLLTLVVPKVRKVPPPGSVTRLAWFTGVLPFVVWGVMSLLLQ